MSSPRYFQTDGREAFCHISSQAERERLHDRISAEGVRLDRLLEYNHAALIRSGIALKLSDGNRLHNALDEAHYGTSSFHHRQEIITPETQFQVGQWNGDPPGYGIDPRAVGIGTHTRKTTSIVKMGMRIIENGELVDVVADPDPVFGFSEEDVLFAGSLLDTMHAAVTSGSLPHLDTSHAMLNSLIIHPNVSSTEKRPLLLGQFTG